ncbi:MAG: hypothetical protein JNK50_09060 [Bacteroidia bacterium]|nr:hypothetical protein [Bacteroidia bacterium]
MRNNLAAWFKITLLFAGLIMIVSSCKKTAGEGGKASIKGKIWVENWNASFTVLNDAYAGADVDVYIIYGDETNYGDKQSANYNGEFEFKYLRKGKYKVYVYSQDKTFTSQSGDTVVVKEIEIKEKKEKADLGTITIFD